MFLVQQRADAFCLMKSWYGACVLILARNFPSDKELTFAGCVIEFMFFAL